MRVGLLLALVIAGILPACTKDGGYGQDYLVDELPDQDVHTVYRPRSAKEAMRHAARLVEKERSKEHQYALLQGAGLGRGMRVQVYDVVDVTTSRYNYPQFRRFRQGFAHTVTSRFNPLRFQDLRKAKEYTERKTRAEMYPKSEESPPVAASAPQGSLRKNVKPPSLGQSVVQETYDPEKAARRARIERNRCFKSLRKSRNNRYKRDIIYPDSGPITLPPMKNDWNIIKKKKKKKKRKKNQIEETTTEKKFQMKTKIPFYMRSEEPSAGRRRKGLEFVQDIDQELDKLFQNVDEHDEYTRPPLTTTEKGNYVLFPKNWQNPPEWKPPPEGVPKNKHLGVKAAMQSRRRPNDIVTINYRQERLMDDFDIDQSPVTSRNFQIAQVETSTVYDWKNYDHPLSDTNKERAREKEGIVLKPGPEDWPEPTHPADGIYDWHKTQIRLGSLAPRPVYSQSGSSGLQYRSYHKSEHRGTPWPAKSYTSSWTNNRINSEHRVNPWPAHSYTSSWINNRIISTPWSWSRPAEEETAMFRRNDMWQTRPWLPKIQELQTGGPPLAYQNMVVEDMPEGQQRSQNSKSQYQNYQSYYANHTNYQQHYYQSSYQQYSNNSASFHNEQGQHYQDKNQAFGHYQSQYHYHGQNKGQQSKFKSPSNYYNALDNTQTAFKFPYRAAGEYAGNDRDLRVSLPPKVVYNHNPPAPGPPNLYPTRGRVSPRYRRPMPMGRRSFPSRRWQWRGARPANYHGIFGAPLQRVDNATVTRRPGIT